MLYDGQPQEWTRRSNSGEFDVGFAIRSLTQAQVCFFDFELHLCFGFEIEKTDADHCSYAMTNRGSWCSRPESNRHAR